MTLLQPADRTDATRRFVVWPHHPDTLQRPGMGRWGSPSMTQAWTWNVFRTFELLPPVFWLRRLNACLDLEPLRPAPVTASVRLWPPLYVPPDAGGTRRPAVEADVLIETEHAVWALLVCHAGDVVPDVADTAADPLAMQAYAASWHAGRRQCYAGLIVASVDDAALVTALVRRYRTSPAAPRRRVPPRGHDSSNIAGFGVTTWARLVTILRDAACADTIDAVDRTIAGRTLAWCGQSAL